MCGFTGLFDGRGHRPIDVALLKRMNDRIAHRGPDDQDMYAAPGIGLGHRRLSIIDLAGGHQPLFNEDGSVVVVYNGEIYNFAELTDILAARGHRFKTHSDTEVLVHAWEEWGPACVERFRGMFAFAIWDANTETLFLARDRLGIKPLYYAWLPDGTLAFGSELKALTVHPDLPRAIDAEAVEDYFAYGYVPDPKTIYAGVCKLPPAHVLTVPRGRSDAVPACYWTVAFAADGPPARDIAGELIERLTEAVRIRLMSEVPLGAFLSGGVDSSAVVALMAGLSDDPVNTCSIAFSDSAYDESRYAAQVAERYATNHRVNRVDPDAFDLIDRLAGIYDEPFADSSAMPTYRVCGLARQQVTVALSGDGGDELFAGYRRYRWHSDEESLRSRVPGGVRSALFGTLGRLYPRMDWAPRPLRAKATLEALARDTVSAYFHSMSALPDTTRHRLYGDGLRRRLQGYHASEVLRRHMQAAPADDHVARVQYADLKTYLPGDILTKVDRASMAHSLEVRVPILDHEFVEWTATLPTALKLHGREGKYAFKKALEPLLPHDVLYRPKMGFAVPLGAWFRGPLRDRVRASVTGPAMADSGLFNMDNLRTLVDHHQAGRHDYSAALWALLMFESFLRHAGEGPLVAEPPVGKSLAGAVP